MRAGFGLLLFSFALLAAAPVQARSRGEVMAGAYPRDGAEVRPWPYDR